jgi:sugar phosphate permease
MYAGFEPQMMEVLAGYATDGIGYFAGILSGNSMAHLAVNYGWQTMFLVLAAVAGVTSVVAALALWQRHVARSRSVCCVRWRDNDRECR